MYRVLVLPLEYFEVAKQIMDLGEPVDTFYLDLSKAFSEIIMKCNEILIFLQDYQENQYTGVSVSIDGPDITF